MKHLAYSVFDSKTLLFSKPFYALSEAQALRSFADLGRSEDTDPGRHPEDYSLFHVGVYDDQTGVMAGVLHKNLGPLVSFLGSPVRQSELAVK